MKVCFETFGCRLNRAEALEEEAKYLARGWEATDSHADAQLIVVRGCSVTAHAQHDCEQLIDHLRRKYPFKRVVVTGCLPDADKKYFLRDTGNEPGQGPIPIRTARAYLKVQDGCNAACAFCIVPKFRGRSVSIPFADVLAKAQRFVEAGYREIVVTGCNLSQYESGGKRLPELLGAIAEACPDARIRLGSLEPSQVALETVRVMAAHPNICRYLHIPVQTGSTRLLLAMRRPYQIHLVDELVREASRLMPEIGLGYDLMTGFPDENDTDLLATIGFLQRHRFNKAHVFPYSERPGTIAAALPNAIAREVRKSRARQLLQIADEARTNFARRFKGREVEIIVEDEKHVAGWTGEYLWCQIGEARPGIKRKDRVRIRVRESKGHQLFGELA